MYALGIAEPAEGRVRLGALRWGTYGAAATLSGSVLSGPIALSVVNATHPQPDWRGPEQFVAHYHAVQTLPYFLGFVLVGGLLTLVVSLALLAQGTRRAQAAIGAALASAFAALVFSNYMLQTTFVPLLVRGYAAADGPLLAAVTMSNPRSLGWCIELWAYAIVGVATWLVAPVFDGGWVERAARAAFAANGPVSVGAAIATAFVPDWALTAPGLVCFALWNVLVAAMAILAWLSFRRAERALAGGAGRKDPAGSRGAKLAGSSG